MTNTTKEISVKKMFETFCHIWHRTSKWEPWMRQYIYWIKSWVHIFDLKKSSEMLTSCLNEIAKLASEWKEILFVSTKPQTKDMILNIKESTKMPCISYKWFWWLLTNFVTIKQRIAFMKKLRTEFENWEINRYKKKEVLKFKEKLNKLELVLWWVESMTSTPDAIFVIDWKRDFIAVKEANVLWIPVFWFMDSNVNPDNYAFWFPCNDDSIKSLTYILWMVEEAVLKNKRDVKKKEGDTSTRKI